MTALDNAGLQLNAKLDSEITTVTTNHDPSDY
jgi:hypothetical protein